MDLSKLEGGCSQLEHGESLEKRGATQAELSSVRCRNIQHQLEALQVFGGVDGILLDLGISSMHIDDAARGFSFMRDGPLDMRMNPTAGESAADAVNTWSETKLGHVIRDYGEDKLWKVIARRIVDARCAALTPP